MVIIKTPEQINEIRKSCKALAHVMNEIVQHVVSGVSLKELNIIMEEMIKKTGGIPAFKGYKSHTGAADFPSALCLSVNSEVVHGIGTRDYVLKDGDIVGLDNGINMGGYFSDMAFTMPVGEISQDTQQLLDVTKASLMNGIAQMKPGNKIRDIARAIQDTITPHGYGIVQEYVGHGVGLSAHEDPVVPNYLSPYMKKDLNIDLVPGMILAVEPMVTLGDEDVEVNEDGWTVQTRDGELAAHFEHSVLITEDGHEILTKLD